MSDPYFLEEPHPSPEYVFYENITFNSIFLLRSPPNHCTVFRDNKPIRVFGSLGLSTKEPYVICFVRQRLCSPPDHRVRHRNFIFGTNMHMPLVYAHQIFSHSDLYFIMLPFW